MLQGCLLQHSLILEKKMMSEGSDFLLVCIVLRVIVITAMCQNWGHGL